MRRGSDRGPVPLRALALFPVLSVILWAVGPVSGQETPPPPPPPGVEVFSDSSLGEPVNPDRAHDRNRPHVRINGNIDIGRNSDEPDHDIEVSIGRRSRSSTGIVRFGESITIHKGEFVDGDVVAMGGSIVNEGRISGDCVAIGGNVEIGDAGVVEGDAVCVGGSMKLGDAAEVEGDAVSVWGDLDASPTAKIYGEHVSVGGVSPNVRGWPFRFEGLRHQGVFAVWGFVRRVIWVLVLIGLALLLQAVFPSRFARAADTVRRSGAKAFFAGLAGWILWLPVFIALIITIVGIPVAIMLIFLTPLLVLFGYAGVAQIVGEGMSSRFFGSGGVRRSIFVGLIILEGGILVARLFGFLGSVFGVLSLLFGLVGYSVMFVAVTMGFGAVIMTRFRPEPPLDHKDSAEALPAS